MSFHKVGGSEKEPQVEVPQEGSKVGDPGHYCQTMPLFECDGVSSTGDVKDGVSMVRKYAATTRSSWR